MKKLFAAIAVVVSLTGLTVNPAVAATVNPTATSSLDWMHGDVTNVQFDETGRLWAWNTGYRPPNTGMELHVFAKNGSGDWTHSYEFTSKKFDPYTVRFGSDNQMYLTSNRYGNKEMLVVSFKPDGTVSATSHIKFKKNKAPFDAYPTGDGHIYLMFMNRIDEYVLPLAKRSKPIRTINTEIEPWSRMVADNDGTIYVTQGSTLQGGVDVFTSSQSGTVTPDHSFTISPSYSNAYPSDITFTSTGRLAVCVKGTGVAIFPVSASGNDVVPLTWYTSMSDAMLWGMDFDDSGVMAIADDNSGMSIKWFFE